MSAISVLLKFLIGSFSRNNTRDDASEMDTKIIPCPVCKRNTHYLDSVDLNKSCEEVRGVKLKNSGLLIKYFLCENCGFCFAPEIAKWDFATFEKHIYNDGYKQIDPDYEAVRPLANAALLNKTFQGSKIRHLDYGGGSGLLSDTLKIKSWDSFSYDPFVNRTTKIGDLGQFDLITAFEVFEHVPDISSLFSDLQQLVRPNGVILFSTLMSDGEIAPGKPLTWWYASPRNGHISLFSKASMQYCIQQQGFNFVSFNPGFHAAFRQVPSWANHILIEEKN